MKSSLKNKNNKFVSNIIRKETNDQIERQKRIFKRKLFSKIKRVL